MDEIEKTAKGTNKNHEEAVTNFPKRYPDMVKKLWRMFENSFEESRIRLGHRTSFEIKENTMMMVMGHSMITATVNQEFLGEYYGRAKIFYLDFGGALGPELPGSEVFIYDMENPKWVYLTELNARKTYMDFGEKEVEAIINIAFLNNIKSVSYEILFY